MTKTIIKQSIRLAPTRAPIPRRLLGAIALGAFGLPALQAQDESLADLRAQLAALEAKVAALESARPAAPSAAEEQLREKLEQLPKVTLDSKGLNFSSPGIRTTRTETGPDGVPFETTTVTDEGAFKFKLGALLQPQSRSFISTPDSTSTFLIRRARLNLEGSAFANYDWKLQADLLSSGVNDTTQSSNVLDAYLGAKAFDWLQLRIGKMKSPLGVERWQSAHARWFTDLVGTTYLVPNRTIGAMVWGNVGDGLLDYHAGIFNGAPDGGSSNFSAVDQNTKDFEARLAVSPFAKANIAPLKKLTLGAGVSYAPQLNGLGTYATANQQSFFRYRSSTINATAENPGEQVRFVPNLQYFWGPFGVYAEAAWSTVGVTGATTSQVSRRTTVRNNAGQSIGSFTTTSNVTTPNGYSENLTNFSWQVAASYMLTGEDNSFRAISPRRKFSPATGGWGALQLAARVAGTHIDSGAFPVYADPNTQAERATTLGVALNWILNDNVKLSLEYDYTGFIGGAPNGGDRPDSNAITSQFQFYF
jgi:phosphate-selective porin OprO/OprP